MRLACIALLSLSVATACGGKDGDDDDLGVPEGCNPLGGAECVLPLPSSIYEKDDSTPSGSRIDLPPNVLPKNASDVVVSSDRYNLQDGWSSNVPLIASFSTGVDGSNPALAGERTPERSLDAASPTVVIDLESGERVPHFVDLDAAAEPGADQALIIRPTVRLIPAHHYGVAITKGLKGVGGVDLPVTPGMRALLDGKSTKNTLLERARPRYTTLFSKLEAAGVTKDQVVLAWEFTTRSDSPVSQDLIDGRDAMLAAAGTNGASLSYTIERDDPPNDPRLLREVHGTFMVPNILEDQGPELTRLKRGGDGKPVVDGMRAARFGLIIPACAADAANLPIPVVIYGHGLMGSYEEGTGNYARTFADRACMAIVSTDWSGMSELDVAKVATGLNDVNRLDLPFETLVQGVNNFVMLSLLVRGKLAPGLDFRGPTDAPILDATRVYYYGISQGGIYGGTFMAIEPFVTRGVLGVAAANYSMILERSTDWLDYGQIMYNAYTGAGKLVRQVLMLLVQTEWDLIDPITYVSHLTGQKDPSLPGVPGKQILLQAAVHDCQVGNVGTDLWSRTAGVPVLSPQLDSYPSFQLDLQEGPLMSAVTYWDEHLTPVPPLTNSPAPDDNGTHGSLRYRERAMDQIIEFLNEGTVSAHCGPANAPTSCDCTDDLVCGSANH